MPTTVSDIRTPLIAECPVNVERRLQGVKTIDEKQLIVEQVAAAHVDEGLLDQEDGAGSETSSC